jgi:arylsulfatase A-like enzyme
MNRRGLRCGILALALVIGGCSQPASPPASPPPNVIMVVVDTLRADRVGARLGDRPLTPFLDSLAARSYVFHRAYAQSSWTSPSVASILTSRYPSQHGVVGYRSVLPESELTLPEVLREHGYVTAAVSANVMLNPQLGFAQGYDTYRSLGTILSGPDAPKLSARAPRVQDAVVAWLDGLSGGAARQPKFLYLQFMEPHVPYDPPPDMLDVVLRVRGHAAPDERNVNTLLGKEKLVFPDDLVPAVQDLYDAEVAGLDRQLGVLFDELGKRGFLDHAVVVVTGDHGEEFKEHGRMGHRKDLYEEVVRVPLLISLPGQTARIEVDEMVSLIDLAPTLLELAGLTIPPTFEGRPLLTERSDQGFLRRMLSRFRHADGPPPMVTELNLPVGPQRLSPHERAVIVGRHKLIAGVHGEREYYDLAADPRESQPAGLNEDERAALDRALSRFRESVSIAVSPTKTGEVDADTRERMRALGYGD